MLFQHPPPLLRCHQCWHRYLGALVAFHRPSATRSFTALSSQSGQLQRTRSRRPSTNTLKFKDAKSGKKVEVEKDPLKIADAVRRKLRQSDTKSALELTRLATKDMDTTVSWNYLINDCMEKLRVKDAFHLYNEMKKRSITPDEHTYTILLNGLASHPRDPSDSRSGHLEKALFLYQSLRADKTPVRPNVIHTNAMLKVCARAKDIDSLWSIVAKLPVSGRNAPNNATYTTLLNGIAGTGPDAIPNGQRVWAGVLSRWEKGQLQIDEELVFSMGKLLLSGGKKDCNEALELVDQVFGIHRPTQEELDRLQISDIPYDDTPAGKKRMKRLDKSKSEVRDPGLAVESIKDGLVRPTPGNRTLSLVLAACNKLENKHLGKAYWELLSSPPFNITPDRENYHDLLRLLRKFRAGAEALDTIGFMLNSGSTRPTAKTFYIALSACQKADSVRSMGETERLVSVMEERCSDQIGAKILEKYILIAELSKDPASMKRSLRRVDKMLDIAKMLEQRHGWKKDIEAELQLVTTMRRVWGVLVDNLGAQWGEDELLRAMKTCEWLERLLKKYSNGWAGKESYIDFSKGRSRERVWYSTSTIGPRSNAKIDVGKKWEHIEGPRNFLN